MKGVTVIAHSLVQHNLARLCDKRAQPQEFRRLLGEIASLMICEATRIFSAKKFPGKRRSRQRLDSNSNAKSSWFRFRAPVSSD